jgi:hypothetical protein
MGTHADAMQDHTNNDSWGHNNSHRQHYVYKRRHGSCHQHENCHNRFHQVQDNHSTPILTCRTSKMNSANNNHQVTPKRTTITKIKTLGTITKTAYKVIPTVVTKTKTKSCSIPRRQQHQDPTCTITPTVVHAAVFETASISTTPTSTPMTSPRPRRRDAARRHAALDDRAAFLAARSARLADADAIMIEKRGLDNSTVTITEPLTTKWQTATAWTTAAPSTMTIIEERVTTVTSVSTKTQYKGVTKVISTVTAVSHVRHRAFLGALSNMKYSLRPPRPRRSIRSFVRLLPSRGVRISLSRPSTHRRRARLFAKLRGVSWFEGTWK